LYIACVDPNFSLLPLTSASVISVNRGF